MGAKDDETMQHEPDQLARDHLSELAHRALRAALQLVEVTTAAGPGQPDLHRVTAGAAQVVSAASLVLEAATSLTDRPVTLAAPPPRAR